MRRPLPALALFLSLAACGGGVAPSRASMTAQQALLLPPEQLEFEPPAARQELFRELTLLSLKEQGQPAVKNPVLFPLGAGGALLGAPGLAPRQDLLQMPDAGASLALTFDGRGERWPEDRRDSLQGLSEREAAELVARTLLAHWGVAPTGPLQVERALGAPYAAAYLDGILRINPSLLYLAAAQGPVPPGASQP